MCHTQASRERQQANAGEPRRPASKKCGQTRRGKAEEENRGWPQCPSLTLWQLSNLTVRESALERSSWVGARSTAVLAHCSRRETPPWKPSESPPSILR